jgi:hypothetical protein
VVKAYGINNKLLQGMNLQVEGRISYWFKVSLKGQSHQFEFAENGMVGCLLRVCLDGA